MRRGPVGQEVGIDPGDYAVFSADVPHMYEALVPATQIVPIMAYR